MSPSTKKTKALTTSFDRLDRQISSRDACVCVVGLGTAGLPILTAAAGAGFRSVGIDVDQGLVAAINRGAPPHDDADPQLLRRLAEQGRLEATADFSALADSDCVVITVPTSSSPHREPDTGAVTSVVQEMSRRLRSGQLIIIESTVPPGTTRAVALPMLQSAGLEVGRDFFLAFSPERIDPGNADFSIRDIPKVVGGITDACTALAARFYSAVVAEVYPVSSPEVAETAKVFENTFRFVNISLVNELSQVCNSLGISATEVLDAASNKPFGFMRHTPGPGVGGRCLPMAADYFRWTAEQHGANSRIVNAAIELNDLIPELVARETQALVNAASRAGAQPSVVIIGMAYKPGVSDVRGSLALTIASALKAAGVAVQYHDPFVPTVVINGEELESLPLTPEVIQKADCVLVLCPHKAIDYEAIRTHSRRIIDPTNVILHRRQQGWVPS